MYAVQNPWWNHLHEFIWWPLKSITTTSYILQARPTRARPHPAHGSSLVFHFSSAIPATIVPLTGTAMGTISLSLCCVSRVHSPHLSLAPHLALCVCCFFFMQVSLFCLPQALIPNPSSHLVQAAPPPHPVPAVSRPPPPIISHCVLASRSSLTAYSAAGLFVLSVCSLCPQPDSKLKESGISCVQCAQSRNGPQNTLNPHTSVVEEHLCAPLSRKARVSFLLFLLPSNVKTFYLCARKRKTVLRGSQGPNCQHHLLDETLDS